MILFLHGIDLGWRNVPVQQHARESAVENLEIAIPKAEVVTTGQSSANLCPAPIASSGFHGQEMVNLYPQTAVAETGDLMDFSAEEEQPDEPPAEELVSGQNFTVLCSALIASSGFHGQQMQYLWSYKELPQLKCWSLDRGSKTSAPHLWQFRRLRVRRWSQQQIQGEKGEEVFIVPPQQLARVEEAVFSPQQRFVHLGDSTRDMSSQQSDEGMEEEAARSPPQWQLHSLEVEEASLLPQRLARAEDVESPAEVLATGQSATNVCPSPATPGEIQGAGPVGPSLRRQADVVKLLFPAESLATGQSAAGLCLAPTVSSQLQGTGAVGPSARQKAKPWNGKHHPAEALTAGQRVKDLCPTPTEVNYSLQPRKEIMRTDFASLLCLTNTCPDQVEVWDLVSQLLMGEKCDRLTRDR
ncbi:hypothetical protein AB205_0062180, partial [Aquarana catesbeiana]